MIDIRIDDQELIAKFSAIGRQMPFAQEVAINRTAFAARRGVLAYMPSALDRPTPYTRRGLFVTKADHKTGKVTSRLWFLDHSAVSNSVPAEAYLLPQVHGGSRGLKSTEKLMRYNGILPAGLFTVPAANAALDQYGNLPSGKIAKMRAQFRINPERAGYQSNQTAKSKKRRKARGVFFVQRAKGGQPVGIAYRDNGGAVTPFMRFVRAPRYKARFDFFGVAQRSINLNLPGELSRAVEFAIRTAR